MQSIGVATISQGFDGVDGIIGFVSPVQAAAPLMTFITVALVLLTSRMVHMHLV